MTEHHRLRPRPWQHDWFPLRELRRAVQRVIATHGLAGPGVTVLDFGCGDAPYRPLFAGLGCRYLAADLDGPVEVPITPGRPLPVGDGSADGVVSFQVLEHVWDLEWYLRECRRILRPGGWLLLSTHGTWPYHPHPTDFRRWTRDGLTGELTSRGLHVADVEPVVGPLAWTTHFRLLGYREVLRRVPVVGRPALAALATVMNARTVLEDRLTPAGIRGTNAAIYVTLSRSPAAGVPT